MEEKIEGLEESSPAVSNGPAVEFEEGVKADQLEPGDKVRVKVDGAWKEATVAEPGPQQIIQPGLPIPQPGSEPVNDELLAQYQAGKPLTEKQLRELRGKYFTVKHQAIQCGHKLDQINEPRTNCETCWFTWYNSHGVLCQTMDQAYHEKGLDFLISMRGKKAVKMFLKFMSTLAAWQQQMAVAQEQANAQLQQQLQGGDNGSQLPGNESGGDRPATPEA